MPSPFPGMDPYIEVPDVWRDFHHTYVPALRAELVRHLPDRYVAKVEENIYIREPSAEERRLDRPTRCGHHPPRRAGGRAVGNCHGGASHDRTGAGHRVWSGSRTSRWSTVTGSPS